MPKVSVIALSPMSGLASAWLKPEKNSPSGVFTGAVNQRSPIPLILMPKFLPLRVITVTMVPCSISAPASIAALQ